jgi:translation initiation factor IF-3
MQRPNRPARRPYNRGGRRTFRKDFSESKFKKNHQIKAQEVRLIDSDGENLGVVDIRKAMSIAAEQGLDLVEVSPKANPPVCKVISWSKFQYEQKKKEKEARKNKQKEMKEFRFGTTIAEGDKQRQLSRAREFLDKGHNVKITVTKKGRISIDQSKDLLKDLLTQLSQYSTIDQHPTVENRRVSIVLKGEEEARSSGKVSNAEIKDKKDSSKKVQED